MGAARVWDLLGSVARVREVMGFSSDRGHLSVSVTEAVPNPLKRIDP